MSLITSLLGGSPPGTVMCGLEPSVPVTLTAPGFSPPGASVGDSVGATGGGSVAWAWGVASPSSDLSEEEPHAANGSTASSRGRANRYRRMAAAKGSASAEEPGSGGRRADPYRWRRRLSERRRGFAEAIARDHRGQAPRAGVPAQVGRRRRRRQLALRALHV